MDQDQKIPVKREPSKGSRKYKNFGGNPTDTQKNIGGKPPEKFVKVKKYG